MDCQTIETVNQVAVYEPEETTENLVAEDNVPYNPER